MKLLTEKLNEILKQIPKDNFNKMIKCVENHYSNRGFTVDSEVLIDFFETNFGTGIWYDSLRESISESDYSSIIKLEDHDWEKADYIGCLIGEYIVKNLMHNTIK